MIILKRECFYDINAIYIGRSKNLDFLINLVNLPFNIFLKKA